MTDRGDAFLSEEDLDLRNLSDEELVVYWNLWLAQAQITNDLDEALYSHGVFERDPAVPTRDACEVTLPREAPAPDRCGRPSAPEGTSPRC